MKLPHDSEKKRPAALLTHDLFSLFISVSGPPVSGKSTVAFISEKALREAGANVTVKTEIRNPDAYRETLDSRKRMIEGRSIIITEHQAQNSSLQ